MCDDCGCEHVGILRPAVGSRKVGIHLPVLQLNMDLAEINRKEFARRGVRVVNLISSPGSGKTTLLQALARRLGSRLAVIVGDPATDRDAVRLREVGCQALQIETQGACHLDARAVQDCMARLAWDGVELLVIENVGNLVCPASYDLGEDRKVVLLSVTEGDDKVLKYPSIFQRAGAVVLTKIDLLPYLDFSLERAESEARSLNPQVACLRVSARDGLGLDELLTFLVGA